MSIFKIHARSYRSLLIIFILSMSILFGCNKTSNSNESNNPLVGNYNFSTNFQKPSADNPATLDKKEIFTGTIELKTDGTFFISGTDMQQWPWQNQPQNRHEEEKGIWQVKNNLITFNSPNMKEGGWSLSGAFQFFILKNPADVEAKIGNVNLQYHLLKNSDKLLLLLNP